MQTMARAADGLTFDRLGRLAASDSAARRFIDAQIADVAAGGPGGITAISRPSDRRPYILLVAPLTSALAEGLVGSVPGGALIVVHDPDADLNSPAELLQRGLGLPQG